MTFQHPFSNYKERFSRLDAFLYVLFFGPFYFAVKGIWGHAVLSAFLAVFTFGVAWLIYPFFAPTIVKNSYLRQGWFVV